MKILAGFRVAPAAASLFLATMPGFAQCAMCRASLLNSRETAVLIEGLRQGIFLLLAIPLLIAAVVWVRLKRAPDSRQHSAEQQSIQDGKACS